MAIDTGIDMTESHPKVVEARAANEATEILDKGNGKRNLRRTLGKLVKYGLIAGGAGLGLMAFGPGALAGLAAIHGIAGTAAAHTIATFEPLLHTTAETAFAAGTSVAAVTGVAKAAQA